MNEVFCNTFKALRHEQGHDRPRDTRPMWQRRLSTASEFCRAVVACGYLSEEQMQRAAQRYRLGCSRDGGVIFWQIDEHEVLRDGKIMHYLPDCHRDHDRKPSWVSYHLRRNGLLPEDWKAEHCLFGLHQLNLQFDNLQCTISTITGENCKSVAVVEAEKTAVIMSEVKPEYIWMATGGKTELSVARLKPLAGHRVILFPDTDETGETYRDWYDVAEAATDVFGKPFTVSSILEQQATKAQKAAKIDIVDLLFPHNKYGTLPAEV
ncbi:MAG: hypothetical protein J5729_02290 [Bacteroidaceae bacterium]|nr:hypothetical protein [Bacteroidaceae bacterium]